MKIVRNLVLKYNVQNKTHVGCYLKVKVYENRHRKYMKWTFSYAFIITENILCKQTESKK